ncbi:MAG TPA: pyrimidine-nucleoside phosphorylase [Elusimicrobia bacterium]|nr:pyrimidine-nucleoside phosphorylase [Elusimicrobiota bacterium]
MRMYDLIYKKRNGAELSKEEISFIIGGFTKGEIPDYQMAAFLMTVYFRSMTARESTDLTMAMVNSGERVDLSQIKGFKVDKHSTGGVGDTTSLVLGPIVAACGGKVAKMTGRGLGHTGGTIDKLESIPGFTCSLSKEKFVENVNSIGLALMGQTAKLAPADKVIYSLRDVTATVDSIPLIAGSIMSKKLAAGSDGIVLDVKTGSGAFMEKYEDALKLAQAMVDIGEGAGKKMVAFITSMEEPLGFAIGNSIEVKEAIDTLSGIGPKDLTDLCVELGSNMLLISGLVKTVDEGKKKLREVIATKKGIEKLKQMTTAQGGNPAAIDNPSLLPQCKKLVEIKSEKSGYVEKINALEVGISSLILGAGRTKKEDIVDPSVGIYLKKKVGDKVEKDEPLAIFHTDSDEKKFNEAKNKFLNAYTIGAQKVNPPKFFYARVTKDKVEEYK